jgi:hypothetical protein
VIIQYDVCFTLNNNEKIVVFSSEPIDELHCCSDTPIVFLQGNNYCILSNDSIHETMYSVCAKLKKALNGKLQIAASIKQDLGYLQNEENHGSIFYPELITYWLWGPTNYPNPKMNAWLYNDHDGSIIFEITPIYPWEFEGAEQDSNFIPYEEWIKSYKPFLIRKIPIEVARQWLDQAASVLNKIEENMARLTVEALEREKKEKEQLASSRDANKEKTRK